jgi:hypothetical protein
MFMFAGAPEIWTWVPVGAWPTVSDTVADAGLRGNWLAESNAAKSKLSAPL